MDGVMKYVVNYASATTTRNGNTSEFEPALFTLETKDPSIAISGLSQDVPYSFHVSAARNPAANQGKSLC